MKIRSICCGDGLDPSRPLLGANFSLSGPLHSTSCLSTRNSWTAPITVFRPDLTSQSHVSNVPNVLLLPRNTWQLVHRIAIASLHTSCSCSCHARACVSDLIRRHAIQRIDAHSAQQPDAQPDHEPQPRGYKVQQIIDIFITSAIRRWRQDSRPPALRV